MVEPGKDFGHMVIFSSSIDQSGSYLVSSLLHQNQILTGIETIAQGSEAADSYQCAEDHSPKLSDYDSTEIESDRI